MIRQAAQDAKAMRDRLEEQKDQAERDALVAAARVTVEQTLVTPDGKWPVKGADLTLKHTDVENELVVLSDGDVSLAVRDGEVRLAVFDDGWSWRSGPLESLADLGEVLA